MKRSNIPQEISNNFNRMNHRDDDGESEFSVDSTFVKSSENIYASSKLGFNNQSISGHIYENISHASKKKYKILSELVVNLRSRTRDLKLRRKMKTRTVNKDDEYLISPNTQSTDDDITNDINSYTSCEEENIYENLNFNFHQTWGDSETVIENDALGCWLENLTTTVEDYESDCAMISKCIPCKNRNISCTFDCDWTANNRCANHLPSSLDQYKLDIVNKCFSAVWRQESETDILNHLYVFLNDIFSSYFKRNSSPNRCNQPVEINENKVRRRRKRREVCKSVDKEKLETFILSVTLNRRTITYDNHLKFYFAIASSQVFRSGVEQTKIFKLCRAFLLRNCPENKLRSFLKSLQLIFLNSARVRRLTNKIKAVESGTIDDVASHKLIASEENIYQPIWKWHTDCQSAIVCDNIYSPLNIVDDNDWEVDSEFYFLDAKNQRPAVGNMFKTVCILYSDDNPELNNILYSYSSTSSILSDCSETASHRFENDELLELHEMNQTSESSPETVEFDSVKAWKNLLRQPYYLEDEEDLIMSETQISSLKMFQPGEGEAKIWIASHEENVQDVPPKNKLLPISNGSYGLNEMKLSVSESSIETSVHGNYRNLADDDSITNSVDSVEIPAEEPKKERERLRDKMKGKFRIKSSKPANVEHENTKVVKEVDEEFFGPNLETVEKDSENKQVPKIVVECVSNIESEPNIATPGLYRVSGNKTVIEAFKKKSNDKKAKKDAKEKSLRSQDVHSVTGILKMFFRELSPPLMPANIFVSCTTDDITLEQIGAFLKQMPDKNYHTLKFLMAHLKRVEKLKEENLMNSSNLAICWGLCVFSSSFDTSNQFFENDISKCNMLCKRMIDHFDTIFKS